MEDLLKPQNFAVFMVFAPAVVIMIAYYCYKFARLSSNNELKRRLAERGFSVDEIERIMNAGTGKDSD